MQKPARVKSGRSNNNNKNIELKIFFWQLFVNYDDDFPFSFVLCFSVVAFNPAASTIFNFCPLPPYFFFPSQTFLFIIFLLLQYFSIFHLNIYISANVYVSCAKYIVEEAAETNYEEFSFFFWMEKTKKNVNLIIEKFFAVPILCFLLNVKCFVVVTNFQSLPQFNLSVVFCQKEIQKTESSSKCR